MATKLKNLKIKKVDFVDNGANPGASGSFTPLPRASAQPMHRQPRPLKKFPRMRTSPPFATLWLAAGCAKPQKKSGITAMP